MFTEEKLEALASIEHDQWIQWANALKSDLESIDNLISVPTDRDLQSARQLIKNRLQRWEAYFVPYNKLTEEVKSYDRPWAKKVMDELRPKTMKEAIQGIISISGMLGWRYSVLEPTNKSEVVQGLIIGTDAFCHDTINIINNFMSMLEEQKCMMNRSSKISDSDGKHSDG